MKMWAMPLPVASSNKQEEKKERESFLKRFLISKKDFSRTPD
jgi:hypothetical protein